MFKKICILFFVLCAVGFAQRPKYIFLFIGDGMSTPQRMFAEEFGLKTGYGEISFNHFPHHASTRTCSANSLVTDSAAAATAIACGAKANNGQIGMDPQMNRLESSAEVAKKLGYKVGIVSTVTINHATPAGFYGHRPNRGQGYDLGRDLIASNFDYFGGGGLDCADDKDNADYQGNIYELAADAGYKVVSGRAALTGLTVADLPVWARHGEGAMPSEIDSVGNDNAMHLYEFVEKGIELLDNPDGFFFMIEGGSIDWGGHANDTASNLHEVLGLDKAVRVALDFYNAHQDETLIIVTGDHETGGMTMGFAATGYAIYPERIANQKCSIGAFGGRLISAKKHNPEFTFEDAKPLLEEWFGFKFVNDNSDNPMILTENEIQQLRDAYDRDDLPNMARVIISHKAGIGWTSGSHTALPVLTTSIGCQSEVFSGFMDNTDISKKLKEIIAK